MPRSLPEDPLIRRLVQQARASQLSRRTVLAGGVGGAAALALAACAPESSGGPTPATDQSDSDPTLKWANWPGYMDEDDEGNYPTLLAFTEQTGIEVDYLVEINDNNEYYAKVRDQLALGQDIGADLITLTDWMAGRLIRLGYTQELNEANIPNKANLVPDLLNVGFDPGRTHSLPWQGGFAGLCWNKEKLPNGLKTLDDLWDPELAGKIVVLSEMRDTMGLILLDQGIDISQDFSEDDFNAALDIFREKVTSGQIGAVRGNSYTQDLINGDAIAGIVWSGDVTLINGEVGSDLFEFAIPESGGTLWNDNLMIPIGSPRKKNAETLINYYYEPEVAAEVALWVNYITPVVGAKEAAVAIDPEAAENQLIFPNEETLAQVKTFRALTGAEEQSFSTAFQSVLVGA
ncbi:ABC transporter substrate-binding protein [Pseudolysinimonas yzui]|uniref:ABC transporter substrate-binding protein n=1 Tax=Pseudolysinimonas yzui TaxID=2708254 RepID=A0A8J3GNG4_9MICO|nr:spermidine/putrescine ABC transporter substrate-binding protein [Pseudolysinimonas yzui]GHF07362.1 ABC transporter substrate-binding protein [Pseudolysinimonas yzui]